MNNSLPYKVLYSDGNERCTKCYSQIRWGCIQIAIMMQSDDDDCHFPEWYHQPCFFKTRLPSTEAAFDGFSLLRYKDQWAIRDDLGTLELEPTEPDKLPDFAIEYAKTNRDLCLGCDQRIQKSEIRIMKVVHSSPYTTIFDGKATWYHVLCFARLRHELNWLQSAEAFPGYRRLFEEDKEIVMNYIPLIKRSVVPAKTRTSSDLAELEKQIRQQNDEYYEIYDLLEEKLSKDDQIEILNANLQIIPDTQYQILHHLTDIIYFGTLGLCEKCGIGQLIFNNSKYICTHVTGWDKCDNEVREPQRLLVTIPPNLLTKYPFLKTDSTVRTRALHCFRTIDESGNDLVYGPYKDPPLFNMEFVIIGDLSRSKKDIENTIKKLGGKVAPRVHYKLAAVISNQDEIQRMSNQMTEAKAFDIQVVSEDFLTDIQQNKDPILHIITEKLCSWGGDPYARIEKSETVNVRKSSYYTKSVPKVVTFKWKDGNEVDPESGLNENAHVYCRKVDQRDLKYSAILGHVDIQNNRNSYYRMQLLESNSIKLYWVFESWGRISTVIGSKRLTNYGTLYEALKHFHSVYEEKTGHPFETLQFFKKPNKFYHLDIDFESVKKSKTLIQTKLSEPVYQLMEMLFDIKQMENMMIGCDLDLKQMPLGKISKKQIHLAMTTLKEISCLIQQSGTFGQLRETSNRFYTLIPHAFGVERPPVIDSLEVINAKNEMLESLLNMELIYGFLNEESGEKLNPLDACYQKLKAEVLQVEKNGDMFKYLCSIVQNTHGVTHSQYKLEVLDIFRVVREGEEDRFNAFRSKYANQESRALLWHGSRLTNFVSILTNGLKVAPPEAAHTGYMFGKGIYFADVVTKSANYCHTNRANNIGLLLMCEVALGNMRKHTIATHVRSIPNGTWQSVGGVGIYCPMDWRLIHGVTAPFGDIKLTKKRTGLHYNEYIVYDPAQVKIKFLFKVKFHYH